MKSPVALSQLILFQKIIEKGSMAAAGRELGLSATTVSERLSSLEAHYGVTLLNRTTRALHLTEEGRVLLEGAQGLISQAEELDQRVRLGAETLSGPIRLSAPLGLGRAIIEPIINDFLTDHPQTSIDLILTDGYVNMIQEGMDMAVRFGDLLDSTLRARVLGENSRYVVATPAYLEKYGTPQVPDDLLDHNCLLMRFGMHLDNIWRFQQDGKPYTVMVKGNRIVNDGQQTHHWCLKGYGIALKSVWDVRTDVAEGRLVRVLTEYAPPPTKIHLLFPPSRSQPRRVKVLADRLAHAFSS